MEEGLSAAPEGSQGLAVACERSLGKRMTPSPQPRQLTALLAPHADSTAGVDGQEPPFRPQRTRHADLGGGGKGLRGPRGGGGRGEGSPGRRGRPLAWGQCLWRGDVES